ncbi:DNA polymerase IV [Poriferisphaera corsica]|uniref:DNA polymerase IV n=1 Tax=Poriferisphaera corsica TaxID=2528020 RepID=A0A517YWT0_9BACT|nr:DNA polymerase [Poriferisphaera corsica]QDU34672.1 DNA polymerase IV [Poriferisphaera corsica]
MAHSLRYIFIDMNSFFASVEQQEQGLLRSKPIGVIPTDCETTCCIAASYEAKRFGIKTGTGVREARQLCPDIQFVLARPKIYVEYHHRIVEAVESCLHVDQVCSIDEMYGKLLGTERETKSAINLGYLIKARIAKDIGPFVRCSIGIGPNIWLAKIATEFKKPDGLTVIDCSDLPQKLHKFELRDLTGIGKAMERRLHSYNIRTVKQLCECDEHLLSKVWGSKVHGSIWWSQLRGQDLPSRPTHRRTVSHSHVLPPDLRTDQGAYAVCVRMIHKAAARLRTMKYTANHMWIKIYYLEEPRWKHRVSLGSCRDTLTMVRAFAEAWPKRTGGRPFKVAIELVDLTNQQSTTLPLFQKQEKLDALAAIMDKIDDKYGHHTVYLAPMFGAQKTAPTRVSFTQIPELDEFDIRPTGPRPQRKRKRT